MQADKMIIGENVVFSTDCKKTGLNNNVIVCGCSGCGKTMSVSEPFLLETFNSSLIVTVTKRKIVKKYKSLFRKRKYNVYDMNFINPEESNITYDPLAYIKSDSDVIFLAKSIVKSDPQKYKTTADPYWDETAISLLSALISYTLMTNIEPTFTDVLNLLDSMEINEVCSKIETSIDYKFDYIEKRYPNCFAISCWRSFRQLPIKTATCVFSTLNTMIDTVFSPELREMITKQNSINFEKLSNEKSVLFISTSAVNPSLHCFVNIFYAHAFKQLFEIAENRVNGRLPIPVRVLCDDFATGSRILNFPEYISIFREKQISVTLLIQSESQLESMYGVDDATTIINNCDTYLYMGGMDLKTGRSISERLNMPLEDVLYMPIGQEFIFRRGQKPIITQRYNILGNKRYQDITQQYEKNNSKKER